jgi:hypothetical protein
MESRFWCSSRQNLPSGEAGGRDCLPPRADCDQRGIREFICLLREFDAGRFSGDHGEMDCGPPNRLAANALVFSRYTNGRPTRNDPADCRMVAIALLIAAMAVTAYHSDARMMAHAECPRRIGHVFRARHAGFVGIAIDFPENPLAESIHIERAEIVFAVRIVGSRKLPKIRDGHPDFYLRLRRQCHDAAGTETYARQARIEIRDIEFRTENVILLRDLSGFLFTPRALHKGSRMQPLGQRRRNSYTFRRGFARTGGWLWQQVRR